METRSYAKRAGRYAPAPSLPPSVSRPRGANPMSSGSGWLSPRKSQSTQESKGKLLRDPVARRNAPVDTASIASIATEPTRVDDETEFGEDDKPAEAWEDVESSVYGGTEEEGGNDANGHDGFDDESKVYAHSEEIQVGLEANEARRKILELSIPELCRAADDLMGYIQHGADDPSVFHGRLAIKRRAFFSVRAEYEEGDTAPFIDWAHSLRESTALARVNVVTAFVKLYDLGLDNDRDAASFVTALGPLFPSWFVPDQAMFQEPETTLDLRTWLLIESLSRQTGEIDYKKSVASIFCKDTGDAKLKYHELFAGGHFLELGGVLSDAEHDELCGRRVSTIINIMYRNENKNKHGQVISQLREAFGLDKLILELQNTFKAIYNILLPGETQGSAQLDTQPLTSYEHQQESVLSSQADDMASESQSIIRAGTGEPETTLFVGKESIQALQEGNRRGSTVPPSNQQLVVPRPDAPRDYPDHDNRQILSCSPFPSPSALRLGTRQDPTPSQPKRKRPGPFVEEDDDDDSEGDCFETDTRSVKSIRREEPRGLMGPPPPKRSRVQQQPPVTQPSSGQTSGSSSTAHPQSSVPDYESIRRDAAQRNRKNRQDTTTQKRIPWSDHDCHVLIGLIGKHRARWSAISKDDGEFETKRNQQAYRDKARNLKVDFLMMDKLLPPCFNEVHLEAKGVEKLKRNGKNPFRREEHVQNGIPVGTELRTASMDFDQGTDSTVSS
ncbi:hypothetical protein ACHAPT_000750 [Fusarium lateritium]